MTTGSFRERLIGDFTLIVDFAGTTVPGGKRRTSKPLQKEGLRRTHLPGCHIGVYPQSLSWSSRCSGGTSLTNQRIRWPKHTRDVDIRVGWVGKLHPVLIKGHKLVLQLNDTRRWHRRVILPWRTWHVRWIHSIANKRQRTHLVDTVSPVLQVVGFVGRDDLGDNAVGLRTRDQRIVVTIRKFA